MRAFKPVQQYKIAIAATASPAQLMNELESIRDLGKNPILRVAALGSHAIVRVGASTVTADASKVDITTNGAMAADTDWTKGTGWTIAAGVATATGAISTALSQVAALMRAGYAYLTSFDQTRSAGSCTLSLGGTAGTARSGSATYSEVIVAGADGGSIAFTGAGFTGTIDNVTVIPNLIPDNSFLVIDGAPPVDIAVARDVDYLSVISEDESDTGNLHVTVGYYS